MNGAHREQIDTGRDNAVAVAAAAGTGSIASPGRAAGWYSRLRKPPYQPPGAVFPVVWTTLYGDIAATSAVAIDDFAQRDMTTRHAATSPRCAST